jgi:alkaline phosphatase
MNKTVLLSLALALACSACASSQPRTASAPPLSSAPPKVILIIGDGMDDHQITIARNYLVGYDGRLTLDDMPFRSSVQVQTVSEQDPRVPDYVGDSANSATSMAAGIVTSTGRIATTAQTDRDATTIMELAIAAGFGTGIVTTASVTDATPASFVAHVNWRLCEGPRGMIRRNAANSIFAIDCEADLKANGGKGSIAEQIAASDLDVVLGGGMQHFDQPAEGEATTTVLELAAANGFQVIDEAPELTGLARGGKVLGLFSPSTMPVKWRGAGDAKAELVQRDADGSVRLPEPFVCEPNPSFEGMPLLTQMTQTALDRLDDGRSFMLMIESASVDKQSHLRRPCGQIGELEQLDDTLALVLDYARAHPETLVLVTADHGQAAQLIPDASVFAAQNYASPGYFARLRTREGALLGVNYPTNDSPIQEDHTGVQIPLFASSVGARGLPAMIRQTEIFAITATHLGLEVPGAAR